MSLQLRRVRFLRDFFWRPTPQVTIRYRAGTTKLVTLACRDAALKDGAAILVKKNADQVR